MERSLVFRLSIIFIFWAGLLSAFNVCITNDNFDMVTCKKICARLSFDQDESALYRDTLCISVDSPDIELKGWRTAAQAPVLYSAGFKKNKRLFTESFSLEILIDFDKKTKEQALFDKTNLSISSLALTNEGNNKAENVVVPLKGFHSAQDLGFSLTQVSTSTCLGLYNSLKPYQKSFKLFNQKKALVDKKEISEVLIIDRLKGLWRDLHVNISQVIGSFSFYKWYLILWFFFVLFVLGWFYPQIRIVFLSWYWYRELFILIVLLLFIFTWWLMRACVASNVWYGMLSALCVPCSLYYLWGGTETVLDRFKVLLGIIFAVMLLPLLALACIRDNFELLKFFL